MAAGELDVLDGRARETLDAVLERLIPTDETGPGAREAGVSRYITRALSSDYRSFTPAYRDGLAGIDSIARERHGTAFASLDAGRQDDLLIEVEAGRAGEPSLTAFFEILRQHAMEGMFGDPSWGGNVGEIGWNLLGYSGPKATWSAAEQQIEPID